jgi:hypothetical protein
MLGTTTAAAAAAASSSMFFEGQSGAIKHSLAHISPLFPSSYWIQKFVLLTNSLRFRDNPSDSLRLKSHAITVSPF